MRHLLLTAVVAGVLWGSVAAVAQAPARAVTGLDGEPLDLFAASGPARATVLVFTMTDCPISNRYAPDIQRLADRFRTEGVRVWLVYANPRDGGTAIREHRTRFRYLLPAVRDPEHELVTLAKATVSPEAAVFDHDRRLRYRGRIDDRFVQFGVERPQPTRRDLEQALEAIVSGRPVSVATTPAIGCYLADLRG